MPVSRTLAHLAVGLVATSVVVAAVPSTASALTVVRQQRAYAFAAIPSAPTGLTLQVGDSRLYASWNAVTAPVAKYTVRYTAFGGTGAVLGFRGQQDVTTGTSAVLVLTNGTPYDVDVMVTTTDGQTSVYSATVRGTPTANAPTQPTGLSAVAGDARVSLAWASNTADSRRRRVDLYRDGSLLVSLPAGATSHVDTTAVNGTTHRYEVVAVDTNVTPNARSAASAPASATPVDRTPPEAPTGVTATPGDRSATVSWVRGTEPDLARYEVTGPTGTSTVLLPTTTFSTANLLNGVTYTFTVVAVDSTGNRSAGTAVTVTPADLVAPAPPTGVRGTAGDATATITWDANTEPDLDRYEVEGPAGRSTVLAPATSWTVVGLPNGQPLTFRVHAVDTGGNRSAGTPVTVTPVDRTPPLAPANLTGTAGDGAAVLAWSPNSEADLDHYLVTGPDGPVTTVRPPMTWWSTTGLTNGTSYTYGVTAVDRTGNVSPVSSVTVVPVDTTAPATPAGVSADPGDGAVLVHWAPNTEADLDRYEVTGPGGVVVVRPPAVAHTVTGLQNGQSYTFSVVAVDTAGNRSAAGTATATPADVTAPDIPTGLTVTPADRALDLAWTASVAPDTAAYRIHLAGSPVLTVPAPATSARLTGLTNGTPYGVRISAVDGAGNESALSPTVFGTPADLTPPAAPTGVQASPEDAGARISWNPSPEPDVDRYEVLVDGVLRAAVPAGTTTAFVTGLVNGTTSSVVVVAVDTAGNPSPPSAAVLVTPADRTAPATPVGIGSVAGDGTVTVSWSVSTDPDIHHYEVVDAQDAVVATAPAGAGSAVVTGPANGTAHTFRVVAVDAAGNRSAPSVSTVATPVAAVLGGAGAASAAAADGAATVTWEPSTDPLVVGYEVCVDGGACVPAFAPPAVVTGLDNGTSYTFTVYALDAAGHRSAGSTTAPVTPVTGALAAPTGLSATAGDGAASVRWEAVPSAVGYEVLVDGTPVTTVSGATSTVLTALTNGTTVTVTVRALAAGGAPGALSVAAQVTPRAAVRDAAPPAAGAGGKSGVAATPDGRFSVFGTAAQLEPSDTNNDYELYVRDELLGTTTRLDPTAAGTDLNTSRIAMSDDGRYVVLVTSAAKVATDTNGKADVYRLDRQTGTWQLVSVPASGEVSSTAGADVEQAPYVYSTMPAVAVTAGGNQVFFHSRRSDLVPGDTNDAPDLFRKDMTTGEVTRISTAPDGGQISTGSMGPALDITPDGRYALVVLPVQGTIATVWRKDTVTGEMLLVSGTGGWKDLRSAYHVLRDAQDVSISDDGRYVAFSSDTRALYSRAYEYVAYRRDMVTGTIVRAGIETRHYEREHQATLDPSGRYVFFATRAGVDGDNDGRTDWYRRDLANPSLTPVLVTSTVAGRPSAVRITGPITTAEFGSITVLSGDVVVVATMQALVAGDTNGVMDLYRKDLRTGEVGSAV
ncbi:hypothetical protein AB2L27_18495 [Kineococcus sp. LSe6-4]|uniref:Fibronectin type-III domain-containing protein n=1 Tax=Kineococcus halophytocola TaxID=3234027 RepID=A0ABV4H5B5_9ACTN